MSVIAEPSVSPIGTSPQSQISRGVVAIYKDYLGRGAEGATTVINDRSVVTTLHGSMTKAEHSLVEAGEAETVREIRRKFQEAMRKEIVALVGDVTGRKCCGFLSDHDAEHDVAVEMVVFKSE